jgi:hypothetical protein
MSNKKKTSTSLQDDVTRRFFPELDVATVKSEFVVGYDTYDDDQWCYNLARKVAGVFEILLSKTCKIRSKEDKIQFKADVIKLAQYFNCEVVGDNGW